MKVNLYASLVLGTLGVQHCLQVQLAKTTENTGVSYKCKFLEACMFYRDSAHNIQTVSETRKHNENNNKNYSKKES